jgi:diguanylate cyclase (GGDEF)-like protein/PAS domain S-box-containing protein
MVSMPFTIDIHTLVFAAGLSTFLQAIAFFTQHRLNKTYRGLGWWTLGSLAWALGFAFNAMRDVPGLGPVAIVANNTFFVAGQAFVYVGVLRFFGRRAGWGWLGALCVLVTLLAGLFTFLVDDVAVRRVNISVAMGVLSGLTAWALLKYRSRAVTASAYFLAAVFLTNGILLGWRALSAPLTGVEADLFSPTLVETATYLMALASSTLWTLGFIFMVNQRLSEESRETTERLGLILNTSPDAVLLTRLHDGAFLDVSDGFTALTGYTRAEVQGKTTLQINLWRNPAAREAVVAQLRETGACNNLEVVVLRKDGSELIGMLSARLIVLQGQPHMLSVTRDITDRKQMEEALRESEEKYRFMTENSTDIIWHMDSQYCFDYISPADERLRGFTRDEVLGTPIWSLLKPEGIEQVKAVNAQRVADEQQGIKTGDVRYELELICKDGHWVWTEVNVSPHRDEAGRLIGYHGVTRDITERWRLREELRQQATTDDLTGIANRRHFLALAQGELKRAVRLKHPLALALIDLDHFKAINDTYGHATGDQALVNLALVCRKSIREIDVFARFGGDEFALLLPETTREQAVVVVERMRLALADRPLRQGGPAVELTVSAGITDLAGEADSLDGLLGRADRALYRAKEAGRNRVRVEPVEDEA